ncbi:D-amino acid aminotransferase [Legionella quateirensis]|uniref:Aminodeoxychorismate lyase n=1 Tax=Legionella quateirensis TaxID=45072 RepID=A0A378KWX3_9GAMM|nr:D-amino acid aminotransferase [Legionella quateirensis]KTD50896.1 D-alanine-aminotransferase [Legionella quateirensis]STY17858.1 D-alanine transaminase [Legionella quateirensis]
MNIAYVNGEYCNLTDAKISIFDRGFLFGDAVYEVLPVYHGQPYFVERHIDRLNSNLQKIKIETPDMDWNKLIHKLISENNGGDLQIYIQVTRGNQGARKHDIPSQIKPSVIAFTLHTSYPTQQEKERGLNAKLIEDIRWDRCDIKTTSLLANILLNDEAVSSGFHTSILVRDGLVTEGSTSNVFIVTHDNVIKTPKLTHFCLPGVTRQVAIELINQLNLNFIEDNIESSELFNAKELWISSTTKEIFPITRLNDSLINQGHVGDYWRIINESYQRLIH